MLYSLYVSMKNNATNKEIIEELTELYKDKIKEIKEHKKHYLESKKQMDKCEKEYFVEKMYCINPDASIVERMSTTIKSFDPSNIKGVQDYMYHDMICRLDTNRITNNIKVARDIWYVLDDLGVTMDSSELDKIFE